jgi:hypothetical protein
MALIKIMELVYVILEAGHVIKELVVMNDVIEIVVASSDGVDTWSVSAPAKHVANNRIYGKLDALHIVSETDSATHRKSFYTSSSASLSSKRASEYDLECETETEPEPETETETETDAKNVAIMKFVLGAMSSGWKVRKSLGRRHYTFNKTHHCNKKYLSGSFLSNFLKKNALR